MKAMPSLFISHGAPTFATEPGLAGAQLHALGQALGQPKAIVVVSPHWMTPDVQIIATDQPQTVHDFGGFPRALYDLQYPAPGSRELAVQIQQLFARQGVTAQLDLRRGLDHGAWVPLMHLFPEADVPVVQVSMPFDTDETKAFVLGQILAPLSQEGVLIIGSGSLTHNLYEFRTGEVEEATYAKEFSFWVRQTVLLGDMRRLRQTLELAPHAARAHPTTEHFLPLLVAAGAAPSHEPVTVLNGGIRHGVLAMESYVFGLALEMDIKEHEHA
jgi:4,5-DOPA dioxygenase extradiol